MATNKNRRIDPQRLKEDSKSLIGLKTITGYNPKLPDFTLPKVQEAFDAMDRLGKSLIAAEAFLNGLRDEVVNAEWHFHELMVGCKKSVRAQFGSESNEIQLVGLKKKSHYKSLGRRRKQKPVRMLVQGSEAVD